MGVKLGPSHYKRTRAGVRVKEKGDDKDIIA